MGINARYTGMCSKCGQKITAGEDWIEEDYPKNQGNWVHVDCKDAFVLKEEQPEKRQKEEQPEKRQKEKQPEKRQKEKQPEKRQKEKQSGDEFFGYTTTGNFLGEHNWKFDDYEPVDLLELLLNDYCKNSNEYRFKLFRVPKEHPLLTDIGKPALKNHTCEKLVSESDSRDWKPIVFGILGKTRGEPVMKAFGKISQLDSDNGPGKYFYEDICYYQKKQVQKGNKTRHNAPFSMKIHNDDADVIASKAISYFDKDVSPAQFLGLFSDFVKRYYPENYENFSNGIVDLKLDVIESKLHEINEPSEREKILD